MHDVQGSATAQIGLTLGSAPLDEAHGQRHNCASRFSVSGRTVTLGLLLFGLVWLANLAYTSLSPPVDNIEQLIWVRALEWGYYKHPPLPTWLIWLPVQLFGLSAWVTYVMGAAMTLGSMGILWRLLASLRGTNYASVALLATLCITYYSGRLYYNHNSVLMLLSTGCAALCWQAFSTRRLRWWIGLGFALGLGALSKYEIAVTIMSVLVFAVHQRVWRDPAHRLGLLLASLIALLLFVPHVVWLRSHDFQPIHYALKSSLEANLDPVARFVRTLHWIVDQLLNRSFPALLVLVAAALSSIKAHGVARASDRKEASPIVDPARVLLLSWGLVPLLFISVIGMLFGARLQLQWAMAFLLFVVPALMELTPRRFWDRAELHIALNAFLVVQSLLLGLSFLTSSRGPAILQDHHWNSFNSARLAEVIAAPARRELGGPIHVVIGETAEAGALALQLPEHPVVLIDGSFDHSPWVNPEVLKRCGAVQLGAMTEMTNAAPVGPAFPGLAWRVVKPEAGAGLCPP